MRTFSTSCLALFALAVGLAGSTAAAADAGVAIDELKAGYALKQAGKCAEAIPHFLASYRADPSPKALLNLADCEQQSGQLVAARGHAQQGRDLARQTGDAELTTVATEQLAALDRRVSKLAVRLAAAAPAGSAIEVDGAPVDTASLGSDLVLLPGAHRVVSTAPGHAAREYDVAVGEGARMELEVEPGAVSAAPAAPPPAPAAAAAIEPEPHPGAGGSPRQVLLYGAFGIGAAGLVVGVATGIAAGSKHSTLERECPASVCPTSAQDDIDSFHSLRTWSTVGYIVGAAGLAGGAVLWLTGRHEPQTPSVGVRIAPASAGMEGTF